MFDKVLIANRGEIACRALRSLKELGLRSVAIYAPADAMSLHVRDADEAVPLGGGPAAENYLRSDLVIAVAKQHGAGAVFPGYGFLSENTSFASNCEAEGIAFIGPTPEQIRAFGLKHEARRLALQAGVPLLPGSELLRDEAEARELASSIGYPVMLKSTAGGGGIGLTVCESAAQLTDGFATATRLSENNFGNGGVFLEKFIARARHVEVQIFGDGLGRVVSLGERDCSAQRRNQKVIEEAPAPSLPEEVRAQLAAAAVRLTEALHYRSAGTVEFIYDAHSQAFYFLEVNTRLQVEHGVTEQVTGVDIVRWMVETARGTPPDLAAFTRAGARRSRGHSMQARVYAEAPEKNFRPSSGLLTEVRFPEAGANLRIDTWVETGVEVSPNYDPLLAKLIASGSTREDARRALSSAVRSTRIAGVRTNLEYLASVLDSEGFTAGALTTRSLASHPARARGVEVLRAGTFSTIQDYPGRTGYWNVGIPPSGAMDSLSLRLGNRVLGNSESSPGLEMTMVGAALAFHDACTIAIAGADMTPTLDGKSVERYAPLPVKAGQTLAFGKITGPGARTYLCVQGGFDVPSYLGSAATFTLGRFGGHAGRTLALGDVLELAKGEPEGTPKRLPATHWPELSRHARLRVIYGPHGAPDFFTEEDVRTFFEANWEVHYNSARTGVRLLGPKPKWARDDGGEAGLHPSNIHDCAYAFGSVDYTGDMPIILGPDGPSLGGFVCPATVITADLWKIGQLAPGDRVSFVPVSHADARAALEEQRELVVLRTAKGAQERPQSKSKSDARAEIQVSSDTRLGAHRQHGELPSVQYRPAGDGFMLVEYGPMVLDLDLRFRVHALQAWLTESGTPGIIETTPGIRSLQIHYDSTRLSHWRLLDTLQAAESELPDTSHMQVPTRIVHLPLSWDDEDTRLAIEKYTQLVRKDAPWAPSNIEFIRRINGLASEEAVREIVYGASYLVLGLGDVYLGAPVATPIDPRHRLVTTKYNPARTWTPENAVGIGGAYLCIYGMEGPGGYQFVGRTLQVYNRFRVTRDFQAGKPWLLRNFDQIRFFPVEHGELLELRDAFAAGRYELRTQESVFDLGAHKRMLQAEAASIQAFRERQTRAFAEERQRWLEAGQLHFSSAERVEADTEPELVDGREGVPSPVAGSVWRLLVQVGDRVELGDELVILESMKMEMVVDSPLAGVVVDVRIGGGSAVRAGQVLVVVETPSVEGQA